MTENGPCGGRSSVTLTRAGRVEWCKEACLERVQEKEEGNICTLNSEEYVTGSLWVPSDATWQLGQVM